jgi:hypothetical protein
MYVSAACFNLQVMGLEGVTVEFPETVYKGHLNEDGYAGGEFITN